MEETLKDRIKKSGLKQKYIAQKIGITDNYLSMCLKGKRNLSDKKIQKLNEII